MVKIKVDCTLCNQTGEIKGFCGGDRYDRWSCAQGRCGINHKDIECHRCGGIGRYPREVEGWYE